MKAVLFDLDNTLYDAQQYFLGAFNDISKYISAKHSLHQQEVYKTLVGLWREKTSMYPYLFNDLLTFLHLSQDSLKSIIKIFNDYSGVIEPYPDVIPTLRALQARNYKLGVVTDGNVERQKRKIELLTLEPFFDAIIYTKEIESKPSALPFSRALYKLKVKPSAALYVGDNPLLDFKGAKEAGIKTIRILQGEFAKVPGKEDIDFEIEGPNELLELLEVKA